MIYRVAGSGPPIVLIHGMLNSSSHWRSVALNLAGEYTVIAPDLIGHGDSAAPRGDYSLGAHAASIRDLLAAIGIDRATIVGHSLGGGVAMQFFYQFPQRVERLALISSGGLGREVTPSLRSAALPGVSPLLALTIRPRLVGALAAGGARLRERGVGAGVYLQAAARALRPLQSAGARQAFLHTLRSVIDVHGQRVSATDRLYLLEALPTMIVWGERDNTIPLAHGRAAHEAIPRQPLSHARRRRALPPPGRPRRPLRAAARVHARDASRHDRGRRLGRDPRAPLAAVAASGQCRGLASPSARARRAAALVALALARRRAGARRSAPCARRRRPRAAGGSRRSS